MINRRDLLVSAAASAILPAAGFPAAAQGLAKTSFGPTTVDISTGHAGHSSLPTALGYWKDEGLDVNVFGVAGETAGAQLLLGSKIDFIRSSCVSRSALPAPCWLPARIAAACGLEVGESRRIFL